MVGKGKNHCLIIYNESPAGYAEWTNKEKTRLNIFWKKPEEWGDLIYKWISDNGKLNTVLTVFELQQGEEVEKQGFQTFNVETRQIFFRILQT